MCQNRLHSSCNTFFQLTKSDGRFVRSNASCLAVTITVRASCFQWSHNRHWSQAGGFRTRVGGDSPESLMGKKDPRRPFFSPKRRLQVGQICHSKLCHFAVEIILSWRNWESRYIRRALPPPLACLKAGYTFPFVSVSYRRQYQEESNS